MRDRSPDLHGSAPDTCDTAVLLVDVINPLDFPAAGSGVPFTAPPEARGGVGAGFAFAIAQSSSPKARVSVRDGGLKTSPPSGPRR